MPVCTKCNGEYSSTFFRKDHALYISGASSHHAVCIGCEQTKRDAEKLENRAKVKARDALRRHAEKYINLGFATTKEDFAIKFGWEIERMTHELQHTYSNGCPYCGEPFSNMGHGLQDITLDICDPTIPPFYGSNTRWPCQTCNRKKARMSPEKWGQTLVDWKKWHKNQIVPVPPKEPCFPGSETWPR